MHGYGAEEASVGCGRAGSQLGPWLLQIQPAEPDELIVGHSDDPSSCSSRNAGGHRIAAQDSGIHVHGGLWRKAGGLRVVLVHLGVIWITAQRAPAALSRAQTELPFIFCSELADAQGTVGKLLTSPVLWHRQREPSEPSEPSLISLDHSRPNSVAKANYATHRY